MQVKFVDNMLKGRSTQSKFDDHILDYIKIDNGIGQGDSLLMVLYQYYNADLLDVPTSPSEFAAAYIDDAILVATAKTFEETHKMLVNMMTREDGTQKWVKDHNCYVLVERSARLELDGYDSVVWHVALEACASSTL